jgi:hypothetical protein
MVEGTVSMQLMDVLATRRWKRGLLHPILKNPLWKWKTQLLGREVAQNNYL